MAKTIYLKLFDNGIYDGTQEFTASRLTQARREIDVAIKKIKKENEDKSVKVSHLGKDSNYEVYEVNVTRKIQNPKKRLDRSDIVAMLVTEYKAHGKEAAIKLWGKLIKKYQISHLGIRSVMVDFQDAIKDVKPNPLLKRRNASQSREARAMAENFHGRAVTRTITVDEVDKDPTDYAVIGELEELEVMPIGSRKIHTINFLDQWDKEKKIVEVCCDADGKQIYFVKGDQDIDNLLDGLAGDTKQSFGQRFLVIGHLVAISYFTDKWHLDDKDEPLWRVYSIRGGCRELEEADLKEKPACELRDELSAEGCEVVIGTPYRHEFGEDGGEFPFLVYDELNKRLSLAGGTYEVRDVGIWN